MLPYRVSLKGMTWPPKNHSGPVRLAISATSNTSAMLPFFSFSGEVKDSKFGKVQKVVGDVKLTMDAVAAKKLAEDPKAKVAFGAALATSLGLSADDVTVLAIWLKEGAGAWKKVAGRRLANAQIKVDYEILTTSTKVINATTMAANQGKMAAQVVKEAKAIGVDVPLPTVVIAAPTVSSVGKNAQCKDSTCKPGMQAKASAKDMMCPGRADQCVEATCCETVLCSKAQDVQCGAGKFQDPAKKSMSRGNDMGKTSCCTMKATCKDLTCGAGMMANVTAAPMMCAGGNATCKQAECCSAAAATPPPGTDGAIAMFLPSLSAIIAAAGSLFLF